MQTGPTLNRTAFIKRSHVHHTRRASRSAVPGDDGEVGRHSAGSHEQIDVLVTYTTQFGYVTPETLSVRPLDQLAEQVDVDVAMPAGSEVRYNKHSHQNPGDLTVIFDCGYQS